MQRYETVLTGFCNLQQNNRMKEGVPEQINLFSIAFYNLENLFDTQNDPLTLDDDFTENADRKWTQKRLAKKLHKLGKVISNIGYEDIGHPPVIIGVSEVENKQVLEELIQTKFLKSKRYGLVHFDSPDERGIDNALLYRKDYFNIQHTEVHELLVTNEYGERDYTRDILHVSGLLSGHPLHILVNHWPSRRKGTEETSYKRIAAAERNLESVQRIMQQDPEARVLVMGDFNDDPFSESVKVLTSQYFYNPMEVLLSHSSGSLGHQGEWHLFDQILLSHPFLKGHGNPFQFKTAKIFKPAYLQEYKGRYKGFPFRTYIGKKYIGGMSDHFPVYGIFEVKKS